MSVGLTCVRLEIVGTPVRLKTTTALGNLVPHRFTQFFSRIGFDPSRWF
jgi:alkaline phosphatase D